MTVGEVKVGMRGYGLTVYHGDTIEPFPVEVMTVVPDSDPKRATIWVNCYDERMQRYGPVQGMSGSPIYLWDEGEDGEPGAGGKLIGAFAFGYPDTNECMAGVQPIEYMRQTGERAALPEEPGNQDGSASSRPPRQARPGTAVAMLRGLRAQSAAQGSPPWSGGMIRGVTEIVSRTPWGQGVKRDEPARGAGANEGPQRLMLPVNVGSASTAAALRPMMAPAGLMPYAGGALGSVAFSGASGVSGVPSNVDPERVVLAPGSVLAIPLAFGDYIPAATGTVTDVLPDGTVLGFGHAMEGTGDTALPLATGYTHFVVSRRSTSFKQSGVLKLQGSIVQDEQAAVAGVPGVAYTTSPVRVAVNMPGQPPRTYAYDVVNHPSFTSSIAVLMPIVSLTAVQAPPQRNTLHVTGHAAFGNGRSLPIDLLIPFGGDAQLAWELAPAIGALLNNEFDPVELTEMDLTLDVTEDVKLTFIQSVSVSPPIAKPGQRVRVSVVTQPFGGDAQTHHLEITLPHDLTADEYPLIVSDAENFMYRKLFAHPKWTTIDDADELFDALGMMLNLKRDALYVSVMRHDAAGISVGNLNLPALPSHQAALLTNTGTTLIGPAAPQGVDHTFPMDRVTAGEIAVPLRIETP